MKNKRIKTSILYIILILQVILLLVTGKNISKIDGLFILYYIIIYSIYRNIKALYSRF